MDIPVELSKILITELGDQQVIFLRERGGQRTFPILIGIAEALAIDRRLKGIDTPRPMTHDLLAGVIRAMGGRLKKIVVNDIQDHTFIATLHVDQGGRMIEIDARPSDAIALGAADDTPIFVAEHVMENVTKGPATRDERLDLLRQRQDMLRQEMGSLAEMLNDPTFLSQTPEDTLKQHRRQLQEMQAEFDAIEQVLRKLG